MATGLQPISLADSPQGSYASDFANSWQRRLSEAQAAGMDVTKFVPIIRADWQRVQNGSQPWSNMEAALATHAALGGKNLIAHQSRGSGGGLLGGIVHAIGNIPQDIGGIAEGLNPLTLLPALYHQGEMAVNNPGRLAKPFEKFATGDVVGALKSASKTPIIDLIPGVYTAKNVATGDWSEIEKHPVGTVLDVLPWAARAGKLAMLGKAVEGSEEAAKLEAAGKLRGTVEPQSPGAALLAKKPLKALFQAAGGTTDSPLSQSWFRATEAAKAATPAGETPILPTIQRTSDAAKRLAEILGVDKETRELNRFHNIMRRVQGKGGQAVLEENQSWFTDLSDKDKATVLNVAQRYNPSEADAVTGMTVYRHSNEPIETAIKRPQGAFVGHSADDIAFMHSQNGPLQTHTIYPQNPLNIDIRGGNVPAMEVIRHYAGDEVANTLHNMMHEGDYKGMATYSREKLGIPTTLRSREQYVGQTADSIAGKLARENGHDVIQFHAQGAAVPETTILDKSALTAPAKTAESDLTKQVRDVVEHFRTHADELAKPYIYDPWAEAKARQEAAMNNETYDPQAAAERDSTVARENKKFVAVPNEGHTIDVYPIGGDTGKSYLNVFEKQRKVGPLESALNQVQATIDDLTGRGEEVPPELWKAQERATIRYTDAQKELEAAQTKFAKLHNKAAPARFGELLKGEFKGRLQARVQNLSEDNVHEVFRRSNDALEASVANPQGAAFGFNPNDFEFNRTGGVGEQSAPGLSAAKIRPQNALSVNSTGMDSIGEATLRHFGHDDLAAQMHADIMGDSSPTWDKGFNRAEKELGIKIKPEDRAAIANTGDTQLAVDAVAAEYARKTGHDAIIRNISDNPDATNPLYRPYETTVLKKSALLTEQREPVLTAEQAATAAENITNHNFGPLVDAGIVTPGQLHGIMDDVMGGWQELARKGYDPVYVPFTPEHKVPYLLDQKPLAGNLYTPRQFLNKDTLSFAPQAQDMAIAMTSYAVELMKQQGSLEMFKQVRSLGVTERSLAEKYGVDKARQILAQHYVPYSETAGRYLSKPEMSLIPDAEKLYIPRVLNKNLDRMMNTFERDGLFGAYDKTMKAYKFAVLTGPRHIAHVLFGGLAMMMGEHGVTAFPKFLEALRMVKSGEIPSTLSRGLDYFTPEELATMGQGKTLGRLFVKALGSPMRAAKNFEELVADTQRVMTYLREIDKQAAHGVVDEAAHTAAQQLTNKVYMDIDGMAPVERTVLRHVFPFYAFTKHIMRYVLNYPADHPWRAATLANMVRIEQQDHDTGLPSIFNDFLFLGHADANGNQTAIDAKNFNPFRSLDGQSPLTLAGFLSALSPVIQAPFEAAGLNTLTATPDLYPQLDYDARTGKLVAKHPDLIPQLVQTFLPPTGALQGILGTTENWRQLKKADPNAYNRALMSAMNLPFIPQQRNMVLERGKAQINMLHAAQGAVSEAMRTGDTSGLGKFSVVPFQGQLVPVDRMIRLINLLRRVSPTGSPGTIIPRSHGKGSLGAALVR